MTLNKRIRLLQLITTIPYCGGASSSSSSTGTSTGWVPTKQISKKSHSSLALISSPSSSSSSALNTKTKSKTNTIADAIDFDDNGDWWMKDNKDWWKDPLNCFLENEQPTNETTTMTAILSKNSNSTTTNNTNNEKVENNNTATKNRMKSLMKNKTTITFHNRDMIFQQHQQTQKQQRSFSNVIVPILILPIRQSLSSLTSKAMTGLSKYSSGSGSRSSSVNVLSSIFMNQNVGSIAIVSIIGITVFRAVSSILLASNSNWNTKRTEDIVSLSEIPVVTIDTNDTLVNSVVIENDEKNQKLQQQQEKEEEIVQLQNQVNTWKEQYNITNNKYNTIYELYNTLQISSNETIQVLHDDYTNQTQRIENKWKRKYNKIQKQLSIKSTELQLLQNELVVINEQLQNQTVQYKYNIQSIQNISVQQQQQIKSIFLNITQQLLLQMKNDVSIQVSDIRQQLNTISLQQTSSTTSIV